MPPLSEVEELLRGVWDRSYLTNFGQLHNQFEEALRDHFECKNLMLFNNGTTALMIAMRALKLKGEVLVTPFTFPGTVHAIEWLGLRPVFCDIDPRTLNIDPVDVERKLTNEATGILGVHLFGYPCDLEALEEIASNHDLPLLFDAAHAFFSRSGTRRLALEGDVSMVSLHATKVAHSVEGGILLFKNEDLKEKLRLLRNFGIQNMDEFPDTGINGKLSELHAAVGLGVLPRAQLEFQQRKRLIRRYRKNLKDINGFHLHPLEENENDGHYAVLLYDDPSGKTRDRAYRFLHEKGVIARRYFFPLPSDASAYGHLPSSAVSSLPVAHEVSRRILVLPLFGDLEYSELDRICDLLRESLCLI